MLPKLEHELDAVAEFLRGHFEGTRDLEAITGGEWSQAFAFQADAGEYVVRFGQYREDYEKDRVASRWAGPGLPVPEVVELGEAFGGVFAVSRRVHGDALDSLSGEEFERTLPSVFETLERLRQADVSWSSGYGVWGPDGAAPHGSWRDFLLGIRTFEVPGRIEGWWELLCSHPGAREHFEAGYRELEALATGMPEERYLIHADLVGGNVRVLDGRVSGVVDWAIAMYGDFLHDLARIEFWRPWYPEWRHLDLLGGAEAFFASRGIDVPEFAERVRCCEVHVGLDAQAYTAFTQRWDELDWAAARTLEVTRGR